MSSPISAGNAQSKLEYKLQSNEIEQGTILWLGTLAETQSSVSRVSNPKLKIHSGMFEHPIMVVSRPAADPASIYFLMMTSLHGQTLGERYRGRKASYHQKTFLPIDPAPVHPQYAAGDLRYKTLRLEGDIQMEKESFINVRELFKMDWHYARAYWGADPASRKRWKLDTESTKALLRLAGNTCGLENEEQYVEVPNKIDGLELLNRKNLADPRPSSEPSRSLHKSSDSFVPPRLVYAHTWDASSPILAKAGKHSYATGQVVKTSGQNYDRTCFLDGLADCLPVIDTVRRSFGL